MDSVRVAVRVRPFNQRELDLNAQLCISMNGRKTTITNPKQGERVDTTKCEDVREFTYDFSYWSVDPQHTVFHSQEEIYENLGSGVVDNAYDGYNACVFAYGQTGSGKTYTMMGTQAERGLIPRICYRLFDKMDLSGSVRYKAEVSYLEIYNEQVKDLLQKQEGHSLRVREHPQTGPYVEQLSKHLVSSYADISELIERGNTHRTTASTGMNDTSSRSHAIFTIGFSQAALVEGLPSEKMSKIHLVDLAGSERAKATGATGCRLREGAHINKSLVTLGSVISALAEASHRPAGGQARTPFVPYRDSTLTWLLKDSLGGNAKTVMIAAISPADVNYGETLSTLRYAHRAKSILNKPTVNEDRNVQLIRELRQEIARLRALIEGAGESPRALELIQEKEARADEMTNQWMEGWRETQKILQEQKTLGLRKSGVGVVLDSDRPHLIGIDDDLTSTGITLYQLKSERTTLGAAADCDIVLEGVGILDHHCVITLSEERGGKLLVLGDAVCSVDQTDVEGEHPLTQGCVITLGECSMFRYNSPAEAARLRRAGVRRASSRLSVLSMSACDLAAARSVESLLTAEKRLSWGSSRELSRARQRSQPSLSRARLSVAGDALLRTAPAGVLSAALAGALASTEAISEDGAAAARLNIPPDGGTAGELTTIPGSLVVESDTGLTDAEAGRRTPIASRLSGEGLPTPTGRPAANGLSTPGIALSPSTPTPPPSSPSPSPLIAADRGPGGGQAGDSASQTSDSAAQPAGAETGDSEGDSLESPIELGSDSELMGAFIEHEVQRRVTEQLAIQEQRLRAERAHQQLMNERQLARMHFTHQRQIRKLKSALSGMYNSVPTLPELGSEAFSIAEERAVSTPRLNGSDSPPPSAVVSVPRYILRGAGRDTHFEYEVRLCAGGERYTLYRRYQRFRELQRYVSQRYGEPAAGAARLPPAKLFGRTSETLANERRGQLEEYLRRLLEKCSTLPGCPLQPGLSRRALAEFAPFFQRGVFEFTRAMTS